jgi:hypothetical protein
MSTIASEVPQGSSTTYRHTCPLARVPQRSQRHGGLPAYEGGSADPRQSCPSTRGGCALDGQVETSPCATASPQAGRRSFRRPDTRAQPVRRDSALSPGAAAGADRSLHPDAGPAGPGTQEGDWRGSLRNMSLLGAPLWSRARGAMISIRGASTPRAAGLPHPETLRARGWQAVASPFGGFHPDRRQEAPLRPASVGSAPTSLQPAGHKVSTAAIETITVSRRLIASVTPPPSTPRSASPRASSPGARLRLLP